MPPEAVDSSMMVRGPNPKFNNPYLNRQETHFQGKEMGHLVELDNRHIDFNQI